MKLAANAYAIGPGLHDWERERAELDDLKKERAELELDDLKKERAELELDDLKKERAELELEAIKRDTRDEAFEKEFYWWHIGMYCDLHSDKEKEEKEKTKKEILETMSVALSNIYCNEADSAKFKRAMFIWYCSSDDRGARDDLLELLDQHIKRVVRQQWERGRR